MRAHGLGQLPGGPFGLRTQLHDALRAFPHMYVWSKDRDADFSDGKLKIPHTHTPLKSPLWLIGGENWPQCAAFYLASGSSYPKVPGLVVFCRLWLCVCWGREDIVGERAGRGSDTCSCWSWSCLYEDKNSNWSKGEFCLPVDNENQASNHSQPGLFSTSLPTWPTIMGIAPITTITFACEMTTKHLPKRQFL